MSLSSYLHKRANSQNWQVRMMVPKPYRSLIGKRELTRSLGTPDRRRAEEAAWPILAKWKAELKACASGMERQLTALPSSVPSRVELEEAALVIAYERASDRLPLLAAKKAQLGATAFDLASQFDRLHGEAILRLFGGDHAYWRVRADKEIARRGWMIDSDSADYQYFVETIAQCGTDFFARAKATLVGAGGIFAPGPVTAQLAASRARRAEPGELILELYEQYASQRLSEGRQRPDTVDQGRITVSELATLIGTSRSLRSVGQSEIRAWRNALAALPSNYRQHKRYAGLSLRDAAVVAKDAQDRAVSKLTVNKKLSTVSGLFKWAVSEGYADANPCDGLFYNADKRQNPRRPFERDQLNAILHSPLFVGFERDGKEFRPGQVTVRDWRFWIPLVCLFTGSRIGEIAQLRVTDIKVEGGIPYLAIRHDARLGQSTKSAKSRIVPIHSKLIELGFLAFVDRQRTSAALIATDALFPELRLNKRGQNSTASRFWRTYLERIGIKVSGNGGDGLGAHSFRHGLSDEFRLSGYLDREFAPILGHAGGTVTSGYGILREGTVARLSAIVESAKFEGIDFGHLSVG